MNREFLMNAGVPYEAIDKIMVLAAGDVPGRNMKIRVSHVSQIKKDRIHV